MTIVSVTEVIEVIGYSFGGGALEALKAWCEVRTGKTPGPSEISEERRRPCRAQWGHDLYG